MQLYHVTVHMPDGPWMAAVLARSPELAIRAAKLQLRAPARAWAIAVAV